MTHAKKGSKSFTRRRALALLAGLLVPGLATLGGCARKSNEQTTSSVRSKPNITCPDGYIPEYVESKDAWECKPINCEDGQYYSVSKKECKPIPACEAHEEFDLAKEKCRLFLGGTCLVTTACVQEIGLPDDCYELTALRSFRDDYMLSLKNGPSMVDLYYEVAPVVLQSISGPYSRKILNAIYVRYIVPCVVFSKIGLKSVSKKIYVACMMKLMKEFAPELLESRRIELNTILS